MMKNIVVITRTYHPDMSPVSVVVDKYIQRLKGKYMFHVIAWEPMTDYKPLDDPYVKVYYVADFWYHLRALCEKKYKTKKSKRYKFLLGLFKLRSAVGALFVDFYANKWIYAKAYKQLVALSADLQIDAVISVSGIDVFSHLAAKKYKEQHDETVWITFFTDPYTYHSADYYPAVYSCKNRIKRRYCTELAIYAAADYNIFLENLYDEAIVKFNQPLSKTFRFKFVLDPLQPDARRAGKQDHACTRLIYAGALYKNIRSPEYMLATLSRVDRIDLDLYIRFHDYMHLIQKYESGEIHLHAAVDNQRYREMICNEYDILVNIGNRCANQLPSKMLEMLSTGRPILNFYYYKDAQYEMIEKYPLGLNIGIGEDETSAVESIQRFCQEMKGKRLTFVEVLQLYPENNIQKQLTILEQLINRDKGSSIVI